MMSIFRRLAFIYRGSSLKFGALSLLKMFDKGLLRYLVDLAFETFKRQCFFR